MSSPWAIIRGSGSKGALRAICCAQGAVAVPRQRKRGSSCTRAVTKLSLPRELHMSGLLDTLLVSTSLPPRIMLLQINLRTLEHVRSMDVADETIPDASSQMEAARKVVLQARELEAPRSDRPTTSELLQTSSGDARLMLSSSVAQPRSRAVRTCGRAYCCGVEASQLCEGSAGDFGE